MIKKLAETSLFLMIIFGGDPSFAQRTQNAQQFVNAATNYGNGLGISGAGEVIQDNSRMASSLMINLNEFEKIQAYNQNIQEIYVNAESTAKEGKNATQEALDKMSVPQSYKGLVTGDTGDISGISQVSGEMSSLNENSVAQTVMDAEKKTQEIVQQSTDSIKQSENTLNQTVASAKEKTQEVVQQSVDSIKQSESASNQSETSVTEQTQENAQQSATQTEQQQEEDAKEEQEQKNKVSKSNRLDKKQTSKQSAVNYIKQNFFYSKTDQKSEEEKMSEVQEKRKKLLEDVVLDAMTYSQTYIQNGEKDFEERLRVIKDEQSKVNTETEAIATNTMALKNILQETMLQVALEQKLLKLEAAMNLRSQSISLEE